MPISINALVSDVAEVIHNPGRSAIVTGTKVAADQSKKTLKSGASYKLMMDRLETHKESLVPHFTEELGTIAAATEYAYGALLSTKLSFGGESFELRRLGAESFKDDFDPKAVPVLYLLSSDAVSAEDANLHKKVQKLIKLRAVFSTAIPVALAAVTAVQFFDFRSLVKYFSSLRGGDIILVKETKKRCDKAVEIIDRATEWAEKRDATLEQYKAAHAVLSKTGQGPIIQ